MNLRPRYFLQLICVAALMHLPDALVAQQSISLANSEGLRLSVAGDDTQAALSITLPARSSDQPEIRILFPEHVTAKKKGNLEVEHLYLFRPGRQGERPRWKRSGNSLEYERDFPPGIHMQARAMLQDDGVLFHYEFENGSDVNYAMITAVTDPR